MTHVAIPEQLKAELDAFFKKNKHPELVSSYLFFLEKKYRLQPVLFVKEKRIYQSIEDAVRYLESEGKLWRQTEIKIGFGPPTVNAETKRIYICPFSGKVFGDNTHPHPQDAIYDWVSTCPENNEYVNGLKAKRFFVSDDPEVIQSYITPRKDPIKRIVYSSLITGKLFLTKESVVEDFKQNWLKRLTLVEVQNQNRFQIEEHFLAFIKKQMAEEQIAAFVEALAAYPEFQAVVIQWMEEGAEE